jgi:hypothetical protein
MYAGADVPSHRHARHQKIDLGVSFADLSMVREKHSLPRLIECAIKSPWMHQIISEIDCIRGLQIRKLTKRKNNKTIGVKWCRASSLCATGSTPEATPTRFFLALGHAINSHSQCDATADFSPSRWIFPAAAQRPY